MPSKVGKSSTSLGAKTRWVHNTSPGSTRESKREAAASKIVAILEQHMTDIGLTDAEKDAKVTEMASIVDKAVSAKTNPRAKHSRRSQIVESPA
jgi:hypothetical protein